MKIETIEKHLGVALAEQPDLQELMRFLDLSGNKNLNSIDLQLTAWIDRPQQGAHRVMRGGSWVDGAQYCRVAYRFNNPPGHRWDFIGFRLALSLLSFG